MKKIKYLLFVILFSFTLNVKAVDDCTTEEMNRLRELANKVDFKIDYQLSETDDGHVADFFIKLINMSDDLKLAYRENIDTEFKIISPNDLDNLWFIGGEQIEFKIYSYTANLCTNELLRTEKVKLPKYNYYYLENKDKCLKYPEFSYCKEFMDVSYSDFEKIDKLFDEYISKNNNNNKTEDFNNKLNSNKIYIFSIIGCVILITIAILILNKKKKSQDI